MTENAKWYRLDNAGQAVSLHKNLALVKRIQIKHKPD